MPKDLTWDNAEDIGILLSEKHPDIEPLSIRFTDLHRYVTELPEFKDDPKKSNEGKLEAMVDRAAAPAAAACAWVRQEEAAAAS
ncbi:MAG: Fe-S cluster assembly protein IscX, partial [Acidobacteriia bacterium]|nr:Fe-S cluster assembly protein IscX [Terriglobia bacterium]